MFVNHATSELTAKIVYYGPALSGKTTNLQSIHQQLPEAQRGELVSLATKADRTLFFDFLPLDLGTIRGLRVRVQLYTVPGQVIYNATRRIVLKGADGVVFVADSEEHRLEANLDSFRNLEENLEQDGKDLKRMPHVIQLNKRDLPNVSSVDEMRSYLNKYDVPVLESVATQHDVRPTLDTIAKLVLRELTQACAPRKGSAAASSPPSGAPTLVLHEEKVPPPLERFIKDSISPGVSIQRSGRSSLSGKCWFELIWSGQMFTLALSSDDWSDGRRDWIALRSRLAAPAPEVTRGRQSFWVGLYDKKSLGDRFQYRFQVYSRPDAVPEMVTLQLGLKAVLAFAEGGLLLGEDPRAKALNGAVMLLKQRIDDGAVGSRGVVDEREVSSIISRESASPQEVTEYIRRKLLMAHQVAADGFPFRIDHADLAYLGITEADLASISCTDWTVSDLLVTPAKELLDASEQDSSEILALG